MEFTLKTLQAHSAHYQNYINEKPENCHLARLKQHYDMKAIAVIDIIMFRKTKNTPKYSKKK